MLNQEMFVQDKREEIKQKYQTISGFIIFFVIFDKLTIENFSIISSFCFINIIITRIFQIYLNHIQLVILYTIF